MHDVVQPGPDWPNVGFDFRPVMEGITGTLGRSFPRWDLRTSMAKGPEEAEKILAGDAAAPMDGYIVCQLNCWNRVVQTIAASGQPTLYVDFQYGGSGGFLVYTADFLRKKTPNLGFVASSRSEDLVAACRAFDKVKRGGAAGDFGALVASVRRSGTPAPGDLSVAADDLACLSAGDCLRKMKESRILAVGGNWPGLAPAVQEGMGIEVVNVPFAEVNDAWAAADQDEAAAIADRWLKTAVRIEGVDRATLVTSAAMYLGQKAVLAEARRERHHHQLPRRLLRRPHPRLPLPRLPRAQQRGARRRLRVRRPVDGDDGRADGPDPGPARLHLRPGHRHGGSARSSTPTASRSNKVFGPGGPANPVRDPDPLGGPPGRLRRARSCLLGYMTSTVEFSPERKLVLFHQGKAVANSPDDRACRTKLAVEPVGDIEKLFGEWDLWGWHRVTVYGDLKRPVFELAEAMGWTVLEEA
ncbi:MAG: hypothetical protein M0C28_07245 [Candidatus Moduliflexus flocculans]|nr:hypothetical protein [Candidatus Moduliflexus flocculans]